MGYGLDYWGSMHNKVKDFLLLSAAFRQKFGPTNLHIQRIQNILSPAERPSKNEADHSRLTNVEVNNAYAFAHHTTSWFN
jgi:hypothetical protein